MPVRLPALSRDSIVRHVLSVATGTALAQAITLTFTPLLTRMYGPQAFGLLGVFNGIVALTAAASALSYPLAIVLPRDAGDARALARLSLALGAASALVAAAVLALWAGPLLAWLNAAEIEPLAMLIPLAMVVGVAAQVMAQWLVRQQAFAFGARYTVVTSLLSNGLKAVAGAVHPSAGALVLSGLAGTLAGTALTWLHWHRRAPAVPADAATTPATPWRQLAWRHRDFALLRTPQDSLNALSQGAPLLSLAAGFGTAAAGHYALATAVLGAPVMLLGQSVGSVFYPRITATLRDGGDAAQEIWRATRGLALVAALPFVVLALAGPALFGVVFGDAWRPAGDYARWLAPWLYLQIVNKPAVAAIPGLRLQRGLLIYEVASTGSKLLALWICWRLAAGDLVAVAGFSLVGCAAYLWLIAWVVARARVHRAEA